MKIILKDLEQSIEATELEESPHDDEVCLVSTSGYARRLTNSALQVGGGEWEDDEDAEAVKDALDLSREPLPQSTKHHMAHKLKVTSHVRFHRGCFFLLERGGG